jgi:type IV secretory pathway VirB10-like protein
MKLLITTTALSLLLGTSMGISAYALQSQEKEKDKPAPQDEPRKQDKPDKEKDKEKGQQPDRREPDRDRDRPQDPKQQQPRDRDREQQDRDRAQQQDRDRQNRDRAQSEYRDRQSSHASSRHGRHIPDDRFRASFGREHTFHIQHRRSGGGGVQGDDGQRFQYGGYWFEYTEPWPDDWSYDDDDFYIDYVDNDYYLYDLRHPGVRILVIVVE